MAASHPFSSLVFSYRIIFPGICSYVFCLAFNKNIIKLPV
jgi:hypothetical protein